MNNKFFNKRKILFKNHIKSFIFFISIISFSTLFIFIYSCLKTKDQFKKDPGFVQATPVQTNDLCNKLSRLDNCTKRLLNDFQMNRKNILFLGNSQTGAINNFKEGDQTYFSIINSNLKFNKNLEIKGIWLPNANFKEFEHIYNKLIQCELEIDIIFLPAFLDDTRSDVVRNNLDREKLCSNLTDNSNELKYTVGNVERLNQKITDNFSLFNKLKQINLKLKIDLYKIRNQIFNIKPHSIRKIRNSAYKNNINSLKNIVSKRSKINLQTVIYIPPLLNADGGGPIPYSYEQYKRFKLDIQLICKDNNKCSYYNLENLVENKLWGLKESTLFNKKKKELDFMHFTYDGHKLLAKKLSLILSNLNN